MATLIVTEDCVIITEEDSRIILLKEDFEGIISEYEEIEYNEMDEWDEDELEDMESLERDEVIEKIEEETKVAISDMVEAAE